MLILLPNPRAILDVGLQLSFASAAGILLFSKGLFAPDVERPVDPAAAGRAGWLSGCLRAALSGVAASVSVLPLTMPLSLLYFDTVSLAAPLSSLLILPVIPACFTLSLLSALLGMLFLPLGLAAAWPLVWLLRYCMAVTGWAAELPFASVSMQGVYMAVFSCGPVRRGALSPCAGPPVQRPVGRGLPGGPVQPSACCSAPPNMTGRASL